MAKIKIYTHEGIFHADEVTACALIKCFYAKDEDEVYIERVNHNKFTGKELKELGLKTADEVFIVDVGRDHNAAQLMFDHHQWGSENGLAAAGLVYKWLKEQNLIPRFIIPELDKIINIVDLHDVGQRKALPGELPYIVSKYNAEDPYGKEQVNNFNTAVNIVYKVFSSLKRKGEKLPEIENRILNESTFIDDLTKQTNKGDPNRVLEFSKGFIPFWNEVLPVLKRPYTMVDIVIWYDEKRDTWKAQTVPTIPGDFDKRGRILIDKDVPGKIFINKNGFFAVFDTKENLVNYLKSL